MKQAISPLNENDSGERSECLLINFNIFRPRKKKSVRQIFFSKLFVRSS